MTTIFAILKDIVQTKSGACLEDSDFRTNCSPYLLQRWLSMESPNTACLVNETTNKIWSGLADDRELWYKFYLAFITKKNYTKIPYIKKAEKIVNEERDKEVERLAKKNRISKREVEGYLDMLTTMKMENPYDKVING